MRLSTKGRYASRLMLELALCYGRGPVLLKNIAEREEISEKYLGHLIPPLKVAGLINSSRGAHGGYILAKTPDQITLKEAVLAVEGNLAVVECVSTPAICNRVKSCVTRDIWSQMGEKMMEVLESTTLQNMVNQYQNKQRQQSLAYHI